MTLSQPGFLLLALLLPAALLLRRRRGEPAVLFAPGRLFAGNDALPRTWRVRLRFLPKLLAAVALAGVLAALARPVRRVSVPRITEGIDVLLCLDTSSSMAATDLDPAKTRLDVAREAAARFVEGRPQDRIGVVAFARYADLRCPPTLDHAALARVLAGVVRVEPDGPEDATGIGTAIARAAQVLGNGAAKSKVVVLITDGEENVATPETPEEIAPLHAAQLCERLGVRVYAVLAGATGDAALDTGPVRRTAERTGGRFFQARDAGAVAAVYAEIDAMERAEFAEPLQEDVLAFRPLLLAALALLVAARVLGLTVLAVRP